MNNPFLNPRSFLRQTEDVLRSTSPLQDAAIRVFLAWTYEKAGDRLKLFNFHGKCIWENETQAVSLEEPARMTLLEASMDWDEYMKKLESLLQ